MAAPRSKEVMTHLSRLDFLKGKPIVALSDQIIIDGKYSIPLRLLTLRDTVKEANAMGRTYNLCGLVGPCGTIVEFYCKKIATKKAVERVRNWVGV